MKHCHGVFDGCLGGHALDGLHHNAFGLLVGCHLGFVHYFVDILCGGSLCLIAQRLDKLFLGFFRGETGDVLQGVLSHTLEAVEFLLAVFDHCLFGIEALAGGLKVVALALVLALLLVELHFALFHFGFHRLHFLQTLCGLFLGFVLDFDAFLAAFEQLFLSDYFGFAVGFVDYRFGAAVGH